MKNANQNFNTFIKIMRNEANSWSYRRLVNEQHDPELQKVHERHYNSWLLPTRFVVDKIVGGDFLNPDDRINKGCGDMPEVQECKK